MNNQTASTATAEKYTLKWLISLSAYGVDIPPIMRMRVYLTIMLTCLLLIWVPATGFIVLKPDTYLSEWSLILPSSGPGHAVSLESLGQASAPSLSPYANTVVDPRVNCKAIALSLPVISAAAKSLGMSVEEFGKPRIELPEQTGLMRFRISGRSPEDALARAHALHNALAIKLDKLREDELSNREQANAGSLQIFSDKLTDMERRIVEFQNESKLVSLDQFNELIMSIERSRKEHDALTAKRDGLNARLLSLQISLGIDQVTAGTLVSLQNDAVFQQLLEDSAATVSLLSDYSSRWGNNHFKVVSATEADQALKAALLQRATDIAPETFNPARFFALATRGDAGELVRLLVQVDAEARGLDAEINTLENMIDTYQLRLDAGSNDAVVLEDLKRKQQVAMAVFTTALAKLDLGKADMFASYPLIQMLAEPIFPDQADTLGIKLTLLGAIAGTFLCLLGLMILWIRKPLLQKLLKNA